MSNVSKSYGKKWALKGVSFEVRAGEGIAVVGLSGAGKSTLLRLVAGRERPTTGSISIHVGGPTLRHSPVSRWSIGSSGRVAAMFPSFDIEERLTVMESVQRFASRSADSPSVDLLLERLGLEQRRGTQLSKLSTGELTRVKVIIALASCADLVVLDEPTLGLDSVSRSRVWELVREARVAGATTVVATNDLNDIEAHSTRVMLISAGHIAIDRQSQSLRKGSPSVVDALDLGFGDAPWSGHIPSQFSAHVQVLDAGLRISLPDNADELALIFRWVAELVEENGLQVRVSTSGGATLERLIQGG